MVRTQSQFWSDISQEIWSVQDFSVIPDPGADLAESCTCLLRLAYTCYMGPLTRVENERHMDNSSLHPGGL